MTTHSPSINFISRQNIGAFSMPAKKDPPLSDEERAKRIREASEALGADESPEAFEKAFKGVMRAPPQPQKPPVSSRSPDLSR